jgi:hypothetical protein
MSRPPHLHRLDKSYYTWRRVQIMQLLLRQFSPPSHHFPLFGPNILRSTLFSNNLSLCSYLNVSDQDSHPYRTTGKIIVLYILTFIFVDNRREALPEFILLLIFFWIKFWFVTVIPKYLNCHIFKWSTSYFYIPISVCILVMRHQHILSFLYVYY